MELTSLNDKNDLFFMKIATKGDINEFIEYEILDNDTKERLLNAKCTIVNKDIVSIEIYDTLMKTKLANLTQCIDNTKKYAAYIIDEFEGYIDKDGDLWRYYSDNILYAYVRLRKESHFDECLSYLISIPSCRADFNCPPLISKDAIFEFYKSKLEHSEPSVLLGYYFSALFNLDITLDKSCYLNRYIYILLGLICDLSINNIIKFK